MSNMDLRTAKSELKIPSLFAVTLALVRHTPRPSSQPLSYNQRNICHNLYPTNPALHIKQTTLDNFHETPVRHMSSKKPSSHSSEHVFAMAAAPPVPENDYDDPMGLIKHLRAFEIVAGRPDPFPTPPPVYIGLWNCVC